MVLSSQFDIALDSTCIVGEAQLWHPDEQRLYWVDSVAGGFFSFEPSTNTTAGTQNGGYLFATASILCKLGLDLQSSL